MKRKVQELRQEVMGDFLEKSKSNVIFLVLNYIKLERRYV